MIGEKEAKTAKKDKILMDRNAGSQAREEEEQRRRAEKGGTGPSNETKHERQKEIRERKRTGRDVRRTWMRRVKRDKGRRCSSLSGNDWLVSASPCHLHWLLQGGGGVREEKSRGKTSILSISEPHLRQFRSPLSKSASFSNLLSRPLF